MLMAPTWLTQAESRKGHVLIEWGVLVDTSKGETILSDTFRCQRAHRDLHDLRASFATRNRRNVAAKAAFPSPG